MAGRAEQPVILQPALPSPVGDRNDVIGFPSWAGGPPAAASRAIELVRAAAAPRALGPRDVQAAQTTDPLVALPDAIAHVARIAAQLPFVDARVAAEGPARRADGPAAPPADRLAGRVEVRLSPSVCGDSPAANGTHLGLIGENVAGA